MKTKLLKISAIVLAVLGIIGLTSIQTNLAFAEPAICSADGVSAEVKAAAGCTGTGVATADFSNVIINILNAVVGLLAVVAVVVYHIKTHENVL